MSTLKELKQVAKQRGLKGYSKMNKEELLSCLTSNNKEYILYTKKGCPNCDNTKKLLKQKKKQYKVIQISSIEDLPVNVKRIVKKYNYYSVPIIFEKGKKRLTFIGGYNELQKKLEK